MAGPDTSRRANLIQLARFVVGVFNTAFSYLVYATMLFMGCNFAIANLTALVLGIAFSFKTQGALVFGNTDNRRIFRFVLAWTLIYLCNVYVISRFVALGFDPYVGGALAVPFATVLSYAVQKFFVFRASRPNLGP